MTKKPVVHKGLAKVNGKDIPLSKVQPKELREEHVLLSRGNMYSVLAAFLITTLGVALVVFSNRGVLQAFADANLVHRTRAEAHAFCNAATDGEEAHRIYRHQDWSARDAVQFYSMCDDQAARVLIPPKRLTDPLQFRGNPLPATTPELNGPSHPSPTPSPTVKTEFTPLFVPSRPEPTPAPKRKSAPRRTSSPTRHPHSTPAPTPGCRVTCVPTPMPVN